MVDLREEWQLGDRQARGSLNTIAKYLGVGEKHGNGSDFARLWKEDRVRAEAYLRKDLELTARVAERLRLAGPYFPSTRHSDLEISADTGCERTVLSGV
jgi:hypothetical protein